MTGKNEGSMGMKINWKARIILTAIATGDEG